VSEVIREIRDPSTRDWLQTRPYLLTLREPTPEAIKIGRPTVSSHHISAAVSVYPP